jgi:sirohydrochlorin ferrochelatase
MRNLILTFVCLFLALLLGWIFVEFLVVHPLKMSLYLTLTLVLLFASIFMVYLLNKRSARWIAVILALVTFIAGYSLNTRRFLNREDPRAVPELTRLAGDAVGGHTAIVYFTHGEPETYNPIGWINQFNEFDEQGIKFVPFVARPFFAYVLRNKYLEAGKSMHRQVHHEMLQSLQQKFRQDGDSTTRFYISFLDDEPRPDAAVIEALNEGADTIVVLQVFLTISNHTAEGQHLIHELNVEEELGVPVLFTEPMWSSELLKSVFPEKVYARMEGVPREEVAVAFVGHGQPDEWDVEWATETEQEMQFREDLMDLFVREGFKRENLGSAWMEFKEPEPAELMETFVENGVKKIFYFSAAISADAMHSQIDVPRLVEEYAFPDDVETINLGAWNNHPTVIKALKERVDMKLAVP